MTLSKNPAGFSPASKVASAQPFTLALYAAILFFSALLIFAIQPMFTKMVLPKLGGSPSVWSVAMVVFQTALFIGYVYAHLLVRTLRPGRAAIVHFVFLAIVAAGLPLGIAKGFGIPPEDGVTLWVVGLFFASIGPPFIALAASAPLLQSWFIATGHKQAANPYVLYAASNLGSFVALIGYPFVIEPLFPMQTQIMLWSTAFYVLAVLIALAAILATSRNIAQPIQDLHVEPRPSAKQCLSWTVLAALPSGLVVAVTAYITTDVASAPFLWVLPLALYLLTFVAVFRERPWIAHTTVQRLLPYGVVPLAIAAFGSAGAVLLPVIGLNLVLFTVIALACHGEAYLTRPHRGRLTEFYMWISFGGAVGGLFAGLIAPNVFNNTYEYSILLAAAVLVLPQMFAGGPAQFLRDARLSVAAASMIALVGIAFDLRPLIGERLSGAAFASTLVVFVGVMLIGRQYLACYFWLIVFAISVTRLWQPGVAHIATVRSFFGVHQVVQTADRTHYILYHGTTIHGAMRVRDNVGEPTIGRPESLTYYYDGAPMPDAVAAARTVRGTLTQVAVVGLGAGSIACQSRANEKWTFFEIDREVERIARNPAIFRFLSECAPTAKVVIGDARLTLAAMLDQYDFILLDAFSSDAIPVHLLTREAFSGYLSHLSPRGVMAIHVSNLNMELASVVAAIAAADGLVAYSRQDRTRYDFYKDYRTNSEVVVVARTIADLGDLPMRPGWNRLEDRGVTPWTDDYSNLPGAILRRILGK